MKDKIIAKLKEFNVELLGIINYLDEKSIVYGVGQIQALQEDMQKYIESELTALEQEPIEGGYYKKVYIKTKADLPEESGNYDTNEGLWGYNKGSDTDDDKDWLRSIDWYFLPIEQESKEQKIKDKCSKIYDKVKEAWSPDKRTFEQAEKESKEYVTIKGYRSDAGCDTVHVKLQPKKTMKGKLVMEKDQGGFVSAEELGDELCKYCPLEKKGVYSVPGGFMAGCEGSHCDEAREQYASQQGEKAVKCERLQDQTDGICPDCGKDHYEGRNV